MTPEHEVILLGFAGTTYVWQTFFIPRLACEDDCLAKGAFEMLPHPLCIMTYASNRSAASGSSNERKELVQTLSSSRVSLMYRSSLAQISCRGPVATNADSSFASACTYTKDYALPLSVDIDFAAMRCSSLLAIFSPATHDTITHGIASV